MHLGKYGLRSLDVGSSCSVRVQAGSVRFAQFLPVLDASSDIHHSCFISITQPRV